MEAKLNNEICFVCRTEAEELVEVANSDVKLAICSTCINSRNKKVIPKYNNRNLKKDYGITLEDLKKIQERQNSQCLICSTVATENKSLIIDGEKGHINGLLCSSCYFAINVLSQSPATVIGAIKYLEFNNLKSNMREISIIVEPGQDIILESNGFAHWELIATLYRAIERIENPFFNPSFEIEDDEDE